MPLINKPNRRKNKTVSRNSSERHKVYNSTRWQRLRALKMADSPLCEICLKQGKTVPAEDIHHATSFMSTDDREQRSRLAYDYDNLVSLCKECHSKLHAAEQK